MKLNIYAIKDTIVGSFMNPFYLQNDEQAKRSFKLATNDEKSDYSKIKKDLQLFKIGTFDDESGIIENEITFLINGEE
ncbi:nonstructural protein [Peromfec virus RodF8_36]|uniref:Nonstructural protein n=1 Tax=Peromfec virus RodF8_36 TaxID=2929371 RepID=A0A976N0S4_9VIRU|nr:nonstructural protein [Peromfec virus RodF8_36]